MSDLAHNGLETTIILSLMLSHFVLVDAKCILRTSPMQG